MKILVLHKRAGCDSGCCGHVLEVDGGTGEFLFEHPGENEDFLQWATELVTKQIGSDHVADLDWENCIVQNSCLYWK